MSSPSSAPWLKNNPLMAVSPYFPMIFFSPLKLWFPPLIHPFKDVYVQICSYVFSPLKHPICSVVSYDFPYQNVNLKRVVLSFPGSFTISPSIYSVSLYFPMIFPIKTSMYNFNVFSNVFLWFPHQNTIYSVSPLIFLWLSPLKPPSIVYSLYFPTIFPIKNIKL